MLPDNLSKAEYVAVRDKYNSDPSAYSDWYIGAIGFLASYNGKFFGGYAGETHTKIGTVRNYYNEAKRNFISQIPKLSGIEWTCKDYRDVDYHDNSLIYCDIPYKDTTGYGNKFEYDEFWNWARKMSETSIVIVSEQQAPDKWVCIWQQEITRTLDNASRNNAIEKLFIFNN